jgi:hypothetical protein
MGRQGDRQGDLMMSCAEVPCSPGHALYDRVQGILVEATCKPHYAARDGARSTPPGRYFGMRMVGDFEDIDSERGRKFLRRMFG